jgi:hypothetical protein
LAVWAGHKVVRQVGEDDGELQGGRTVGATENRQWIWRARVVATVLKQRRKGEGGMGKGRPVGLAIRGKEGRGIQTVAGWGPGEWR